MALLGANVPSWGMIPASEISDIYPNGVVRLVGQKAFTTQAYLHSLKDAGLKIMLVIAKESLEGFNSIEEAVQHYLENFGHIIDYLQIGNEWDHKSNSSWTMEPDELYNLVATFYFHPFRSVPIILGGAVSGDENALDRIWRTLPLLSGIAIHPYGQRPSETSPAPSGDFGIATELFDRYQRKLTSLGFNLKLYVTEYGVSSDEVGIDNQAKYISEFALMLKRNTGIEMGIHFCQHNYLGFGVRGSNEKLKSKLAEGLRTAAKDQQGEITLPTNPYYFSLGILAKANELRAKGVDVGEPREPETYPYPGSPYSYQFTTTGKFEYSAKANLAHFFQGA